MKKIYPKIFLLSGSLIYQIVQLGIFPILIAQILSKNRFEGTEIGIFLAVSWVSVLVCGPFVPRIIFTIGYRSALGLSSVFTATGAAVLLLPFSAHAVFAAAVCTGLGLIVRWICCDSLVVEVSDATSRGRMIGLHESLMGFGIALAPLPFIFLGLESIVWLSLVLALLGHLAFFLFSRLSVMPVFEWSAEGGRAGLPYRLLFVALAAAFVAGFIENSAIALFPIYFEGYGLPLSVSAMLVSAFGFGGTILQSPLGHLADRRGYAYAQAACCLSILASGAFCVVMASHAWALFPALFIMGGAAGGLNTLAVIQAGKELKRSQVPSAMAVIAVIYTCGSIGGPVISGAMTELPMRSAMVLEFMVIATILLLHMAMQPGRVRRNA